MVYTWSDAAPVNLVPFFYAGANDFIPLANGVLTIPSTATVSTAVCFNITVTSDMIVENNETFTISVETSNPDDVILGATTATVTIVDDDSKKFGLTPSNDNVASVYSFFHPINTVLISEQSYQVAIPCSLT